MGVGGIQYAPLPLKDCPLHYAAAEFKFWIPLHFDRLFHFLCIDFVLYLLVFIFLQVGKPFIFWVGGPFYLKLLFPGLFVCLLFTDSQYFNWHRSFFFGSQSYNLTIYV